MCNGEIYNFRELRQELIALGHRFKTASDSEVILHSYAQYGDEFVQRLNGMFGFALWDARRQRLIVGRDRLGIKPIYLYRDARRRGEQFISPGMKMALRALLPSHLAAAVRNVARSL